MRFITISTASYVQNTIRLIKSLKRVHPTAEIVVYAEEAGLASFYAAYGAKLQLLPEIHEFGVKRAKFFAYVDAIKRGAFVYLDADVIVLKPLDGLWAYDVLTACRDDLSGCSFIADKCRPWVNHPELRGDRYFNSGVFFAPVATADAFAAMCRDVRDDRDWNELIVPGKLYDNHYLCAKVQQYGVEMRFVSEYAYNWQGFLHNGEVSCSVNEGGELISTVTGESLRLVHFAGIADIEPFLANLRSDVLRVLACAVGSDRFGVLEVADVLLRGKSGLSTRAALALVEGVRWAASGQQQFAPGAGESILGDDADAVLSVAYSTVDDGLRWNGMPCGEAHLVASEYAALRDFVRTAKIDAIFEFGAGPTSVLFKNLGVRQLAIEDVEKADLDFARTNGAITRIVPFVSGKGFEHDILITEMGDLVRPESRSMIYFGSSLASNKRTLVIEQLISKAVSADVVVVHDSVRDAPNVYRLASALNLRVLWHFASLRGLTFLGREDICLPDAVAALDEQSLRAIRFTVSCARRVSLQNGGWRVLIEVRNDSDRVIPTVGDRAMHFSLHLECEDGSMIWDTPRYTLPVDLAPHDSLAFWVGYDGQFGPLKKVCCDFVKEGEFWWSQLSGQPCPAFDV